MAQSEFKQSWGAFADSIEHLGHKSSLAVESADILYLKGMGAHKELMAAVKYNHAADEFNLAPNQKARDYTPDWMFKNAMAIGGDGCGNHAVWMDVSRMDSPVLFICHDPSEVTVLAKSPEDFFKNLRAFLPHYNAKNNANLLGAYLQTWTPQLTGKTGIIHTTKADQDLFDFSEAEIGDSVALDYRGKHTIVKKPYQTGVLRLTTEADDIIKKVKCRDRIWAFIALATLGLIFAFFYEIKGKSILASIGMTLFSLLIISGMFSMFLDPYYSWQEKRKNK